MLSHVIRPTLIAIVPALALALAAPACSSSVASVCGDIACEPWQRCEAGACVLQDGFCDDYTQCADDEWCNAEHRCEGPTRPGDDFFDPVAPNSVQIAHRGLINALEDLEAERTVLALGSTQVRLAGEEHTLSEYAYSYRLTVPSSYENSALAGRDAIGIGVSALLDSSGEAYRFMHLSAGFGVDALLVRKQAEPPQGPLPAASWLRVDDVEVFIRAFDHAEFQKICTLAEVDPEATGSRIFVGGVHNESFAPGEDLQLWANVALGEENDITPETEPTYCRFYENGQAISRDEYLSGIAQTSPELSCELPAGFFEPPGPSYAALLFTGPLNDGSVGIEHFENGLGELDAVADGEPIVADDYYTLAYDYAVGSTDVVVVQTLGSVNYLGADHYAFNLFRLVVARSVLLQMKAEDLRTVDFDPALMVATLESYEQKDVGGDAWLRCCPLLLSDVEATDGSLGACHEANTSFQGGEPLEVAALLTMTDEAAAFEDYYGISEDCYCFVNSESNPVDCAEFEAQ